MSVVKALNRYAVYHRSRGPRRHRSDGRLYDGLFVVYAFTQEAAEKVVRDRLAASFNEAIVIPLTAKDNEGVELEFWYEPPTKLPQEKVA